jgi:hypothetical protein
MTRLPVGGTRPAPPPAADTGPDSYGMDGDLALRENPDGIRRMICQENAIFARKDRLRQA